MQHEYGFFDNPATWVAASFVIFFVLFGKKIWVALTGILDERTRKVQAELAEAQRLRTEAEAMLRDAKTRREQALADAKQLLDGARAEAERLAAAAAAEAEAGARRRERMALDRIAAAEKAAVDEVRIAAAEVATVATERMIREGLSAEADAALVNEQIARLPAALAPRRAA